jgi:hypothetical protein
VAVLFAAAFIFPAVSSVKRNTARSKVSLKSSPRVRLRSMFRSAVIGGV